MSPEYKLALLILVAGLGLKLVVITLMTVRCRLVSGQFAPIKEDRSAAVQFLLNYVFKLLLLVCPLGPDNRAAAGGWELMGASGVTDPSLQAWLGVHRNATESEPWFMAMAFMYGFAGESAAACAPVLIYVYIACRVLHMLSYVLHLQPWRTLTFVTGLFTQLGFGCLMLAAPLADTWEAPYILSAALGMKIVIIALMTVRCRIVSGQFRPIPEDDSAVLQFLINYVFKVLLLVCPPGPGGSWSESSGQDDPGLVAWLGTHRNATEQEPWFIAMACVSALLSSTMPSFTPQLIYVYLACRVLHMLSYVLHLQPWRTLTFVIGLFTQLGFGCLMLAVPLSDTWQALNVLVAALGLKLVLISLMTVRCRLVSGQFRPIPEDDSAVVSFLLNYVFKPLLLVCPIGPGEPAKADGDSPCLTAFLGAHRNATEQEPWFVMMAIVGVTHGLPYETAEVALLYTYLATRVLHMLAYVCHAQPWRTLTFVTALFTGLAFGVLMLVAAEA